MPVLKITSNKAVADKDRVQFLQTCSSQLAEMLSKPESYIMVSYRHNPAMLFAGNSAPLAYLELKSIGLPHNQTSSLSDQLCTLIQQQLDVAPDRVYIEFSDAQRHLFGWRSKTFAD